MKPRRLLSFLLVIAMMFSVFSVVASASGGDNEQAESFLGSNKLRIAGKIDLFGLDIVVDNSYNATITAYKGYEDFSSDEEAGIRIATNIESIGNVDKTIDVGNVGIEAIRAKLAGTQVPEDAVTYDLVYNLIDAVLSNLAKQTFTVTYGVKTSTYTIAQEKFDGYQTLTLTADTVDFGEDWAALFGTDESKTIQMSYDAEAAEKVSVKLAKDSYVRLGNQKRTLKADTEVSALDSTGEVDLANIAAVLMGDIETTETFAFNDKKAVLELKAGTELTVGKTTVKLNNDVRLTVDGLGIEDNLISKIERITAGLSDVTFTDYTGLTNIIPDKAGTIAITAEVDPTAEEEPAPADDTIQAYVIRNDQIHFSGDIWDAVTTTNSQNGDLIKLNASYSSNPIELKKGTTKKSVAIKNSVTLDLNGMSLSGSASTAIGNATASAELNVINSSTTPVTISLDSATTTKAYGALRSAASSSVINIGGEGSVGAITVTSTGNVLTTANATAQIKVYNGTFNGNILKDSGTITIYGGTFDHDPTDYVADDYKAVNNNDGTWTVVPKVYVAQIDSTKYDTLEEAVEAAEAGDTIELLANVELTATLAISKNLIINGNGKTITAVKQTGVYAIHVTDTEENSPLTLSISDLTLNTTGFQVGILTDENYGGIDLTLTNVDINTDGAAVYSNGVSLVKIIDCDLTRSGKYVANKDAVYYSVLNVGYSGEIEMTNGTITANGGNGVGTFPSGGSVTLTNVDVTVTPDADDFTTNYALWARNEDYTTYAEYCSDSVITVKSGNVIGTFFVTDKYPTSDSRNMFDSMIIITGGTFDTDPSAYVADGYEAVDNHNDTWTVGKVKAGEMTPTATAENFDATYTVTKQVIDENNNNEVINTGVSRTINVKAVTEDTVIENTITQIMPNLKMEKVLDTVVASVDDATDTVNVAIQIACQPQGNIEQNTITYEVHPEAIITINDVQHDPVAISNDALAPNASFDIELRVPIEIANASPNRTIKVTHISEGYPDETRVYEFLGNGSYYYVPITVTHFSQFALQANNQLFAGHSITLNGYINLNFYLNVSETQVEYGAGTVVDFTWGGDRHASYTVQPEDYEENRGYRATVAVPAAEMTYQITASVTINGDAQTQTNQYSVRNYADELLESSDEELTTLVKRMLDYGAKAQEAFGINTENPENLANYGIDYSDMPTKTQDQLVEDINAAIYNANHEYASNMYEVQNVVGGEYYSSSLIYLSGCTLRQYFRGYGLSGFTDVKNDCYYYVDVTNIAAAELDELKTFTVGEYTFKYSALDFVRAIIWNYDPEDSYYKLAEATYWYNQAANTYFANHPNP